MGSTITTGKRYWIEIDPIPFASVIKMLNWIKLEGIIFLGRDTCMHILFELIVSFIVEVLFHGVLRWTGRFFLWIDKLFRILKK
jgi:hypothetical protein